MGAINPTLLAALAGLVGIVIGWVIQVLWHRQQVKRQAAHDATKILSNKKKLLEEMISKSEDINDKNNLIAQIDEVNAALLGLHAERLRSTLKDAGLPPEEELIADGRRQLKPQEAAKLERIIAEINALPPFISTRDLLSLGSAYYTLERYEDAKDIYDRILNLNPHDPFILFNRGVAYGQLGRYDEALADFNRSLELSPNKPGSLTNRGNAYMELGRYDEALADLNRSFELKPNDPATLHNLGCLYERLERYDEALAYFNRSLELRPDDPQTLNNRAIVHTKLKSYDEALADFNLSLKLRPDNVPILYDLACLFSLWGKADNALTYLEQAIDKDKKYREIAKTDKDFDNIRDAPRFKKLIEPD